MIKIVFFDIDGTLLKLGSKELTENVRYTLKKLQENGVLICVATGRCIFGVPKFRDVNFDIFLTYNGSYVVDKDNNVIRNNPFSKEDVKEIYKNLQEMNRPASISGVDFLVGSKDADKDEDLVEYFSFSRVPVITYPDFDDYLEKDVYQIMCGCRRDDHKQMIKNTKDATVTQWWERAADIIPASSGKGKAIEEVLKYYGFKKEESIGFGDGHNDIEMLDACGVGVAMGNSLDEVKKHADEVCESVDDDGIYKYCKKHNFFR